MARKNMSQAKKLFYHDENKALDNTYENNSNYHHSKNPSLSVINIGDFQGTRLFQNNNRPKEIEELFESTKNFYQSKDEKQSKQPQKTIFSDKKFMMYKYSVQSSQKKQAPTGKIDKKQCQDDEAQAYNTLISYRPEDLKSCSDSINSSDTSNNSHSLTTSLQKLTSTHHDLSISKPVNPFKNPEFQTFSVPSSTTSQNNQLFKEINNTLSTTCNNKQNKIGDQSKPFLSTTISSNNNYKPSKELKQALSENKYSASGAQKSAAHKQLIQNSSRLEPKLQIIQNSSQSNNKEALNQSMKPQLGNQKLQNSRNNTAAVHTYQNPKASQIPAFKLTIPNANHSQVPKIQDRPPQAKKLKDESDQETIDSHDMSNSRIAKELALNIQSDKIQQQHSEDDKYEILKQKSPLKQKNNIKNAIETQISHRNCNEQAFIQTQQSITTLDRQFMMASTNIGFQDSQRLQTSNYNYDQGKQQQQIISNNYQSASSATKRARWDLSAGKSTLQNSFRKGSDTDNGNPAILKTKIPLNQLEKDDEQEKIKRLHEQYLAIKKQLQELKLNKKGQQALSDSEEEEREAMDIMSPDQPSNYSPDEDEDSNYEDNNFKRSKSHYQKSKEKSKGYNQKLQVSDAKIILTQTTKKQQRQKKNGTQFKSLDVQNLPQILHQASVKYDQSPSNRFATANQTAVKNHKHHHQAQESIIHKYNNDDCSQAQDIHKSTSNLKKLSSIMKSQLQIGLRKLSINKQLYDQELLQFQHHQQYQKQRQKSQSQKRKYNGCDKQHSQVSFVNAFGHHDSQSSIDNYKDCMSNTKRSLFHKKQSIGCAGISSVASSKYILANDKMIYDEEDQQSGCSCCREDRQPKTHKKNKQSYGQWIKDQTSEKKSMKHAHHQRNHTKSSHKHKDKSEVFDKPRKSQDCRGGGQESHKNRKNRRDRDEEEDKYKDTKEKKRKSSHSKGHHQSRRSKSTHKRDQVQDSDSRQQYVQTNPWLAQQLFKNFPNGNMLQSFDQAMWNTLTLQQQQLLYSQSLQQPQMLSHSLQSQIPGSFLPLQTQSHFQNPLILQASQQQALNNNQALINKMQSPTSLQNQLLQTQLQALLQQQIPTSGDSIDQHKEQIEAIEQLIKAAKSKLEHNILTNQNTNCSTSNQTQLKKERSYNLPLQQQQNDTSSASEWFMKRKNSRNPNGEPQMQPNHIALERQASYNSNGLHESSNMLLFKTINSQNSELAHQQRECLQQQQNSERKNDMYRHQDKYNHYFQKASQAQTSGMGQNTSSSSFSKRRFSEQSHLQDHKFGPLQQQIATTAKKGNQVQSEIEDNFNMGVMDQSMSTIHNENNFNYTQMSSNYDSTQDKKQSVQKRQQMYQASLKTSARVLDFQVEDDKGNAKTAKASNDKNEVLWIDFNENASHLHSQQPPIKPSLKKQPSQSSTSKHHNHHQHQSSSAISNQQSILLQSKLSHDRFPYSIPEEKDEDFHSPEIFLNQQHQNQVSPTKLTFGCKPRDSEMSQQSIKGRDSINNRLITIITPSQPPKQNREQSNSKGQPNMNEAWAMDFTEKQTNALDNEKQDLAEAFKHRLEQRMSQKKKQQNQQKEFTKEELFERKKELLRNARQNIKEKQQQEQQETMTTETREQEPTKAFKIDLSASAKPPTAQQQKKQQYIPDKLLSRLSQGQKTEITKKDMLKLTTKNYEQLPEIKKRKEESVKKEEMKKRLANVKELEKKRRESVQQKRNSSQNIVNKTTGNFNKTIEVQIKL